uniref:Uncharacterized protein n=1 Tax=Mus musculus TaxID=10090 RepID=Q3TR41_MOUSE|nr:unnamed protein product [Mus musculus]
MKGKHIIELFCVVQMCDSWLLVFSNCCVYVCIYSVLSALN